MSDEARNISEEPEDEGIGFESDPCVICRQPTVRPWMAKVDRERGEANKEPLVCNKCLVDMRGDMATELEVRRQLRILEAKVEGHAWRQWILYFAFTLVLAALTFLAGLYLGS